MTCFLAIQNLIESTKEAQRSDCSLAKYKRSISLILKTATANSHHIDGLMDGFNFFSNISSGVKATTSKSRMDAIRCIPEYH